jgi:hypothetical protein
MGKFYVDLSSNGTLTDALPGLYATESIVVSTIAAPTTVSTAAAVGDLTFQALTATTPAAATAAVGVAATGASFQIPSSGVASAYASNNNTYSTSYTSGASNRYWIGVYGNGTAINAGEYTVRVRVVNSENFLIDKTLKVKFVSTIADAGAALTLAATGALYKGETMGFTTANNVTATLKDANGGRVVTATTATGTLNSMAPALTAVTYTSTPAVVDTLAIDDTGVAGTDHVAPATGPTQAANAAGANGVYGITKSTAITTVAATDTVIRVRLTGSSVEATQAIVVYDATTARDITTDLQLTAAGLAAGEELLKSNVDTTTTYTLPVSTKTASLRINIDNISNVAVEGASITTTTTWSGNYASSNVSPASLTKTTTATDAFGNIDLVVTNSAPVAGSTATVLITGFTTGAGTVGNGSRTVVITWAAPAISSVVVVDPVANVYVKTATTNVLTVLVRDQFGTPMSGESLVPRFGSTNANYSATALPAAITTGATGTATFSVTDAKATDATSDTVTFTSVTDSTKTGSFTINYVATLPVASKATLFYNTASASAATALVPVTGIYNGAATLKINTNRNISRSLASVTDVAGDDQVSYRARVVTSAGVPATGAAVTVSAVTGGWIVGSTGLPVQSRTFAVDASGDVAWVGLATAPGSIVYTVTAGTVVATATAIVENQAADARFVALTASTNEVTAKVTDRYGNGVAGVQVQISTTSGTLGNGQKTSTYSTDTTGSVTVLSDAEGSATFTAYATAANDHASVAGYVGANAVDSDLKAGNRSATVTVTGSGNVAANNAQAANDAAAEATDAANAATDAANAAAEAADAATAAAQDAADAVAALSTQVSEMVNALKKQITALTNLVIKIQKKVKA